MGGSLVAHRAAHRDDLPVHAQPLARRTGRQGRDRDAFRCRRDRPETWASRCHLRSRIDRLHPDRQPPARSRDGAGEPRRAGADTRRIARHQSGMGRAHVAAHRRGATGAREQVHHAARAPRGAAADPSLLPGSESPTIIPLEGHPDRVAVHAVCRENVFWETLEQLKAAGASALLVLPVEKMLA